eukprot:3755934-Prymnesium_polylepis.1
MQALGWWRYEADEVVQWVRALVGVPKDDTSLRGALAPQLLQGGCACLAAAFELALTGEWSRGREGLETE